MLGGSYSSYKGMKNQEQTIDNLIETLNKGGTVMENLQANVDMLTRAGKYQTIEDVAMLINSPLMKKNGEFDNMFLHIMTKLRVGLEQSLRDDIDEVIKPMSLEKFRETFSYEATNDYNDQELEQHKDKVIEAFHEQIDLIKENWNAVNGTFGTFGDDQKIMMTHALSLSKHFDQREEDMINSNSKAGLKEETELETPAEQIRLKRDRTEQLSLLDRVKNIWSRLTSKQMKNILSLPESKTVMQRLNIREFTSPSHMEELFVELATRIKVLQAQIEEVKTDPNIKDTDETKTVKDISGEEKTIIVPSQKKNQLQKLNEQLDALLDRKIYLTKALNEGLDPELSRDEQKLLNEWSQRDPVAYATHSKDVIKRLKDIRLIRAYRHRMIDMYNQMVQAHSMAARENVTWKDKGTLIPRPELLLMRYTEETLDKTGNLTDKELARIYERYYDKTITFDYMHSGDITVNLQNLIIF